MLCFLRRFFNEDTPSFLEGTHVLEVGTQEDRSPQPQSQAQAHSQAEEVHSQEEEEEVDTAQSTFVEGATGERLAPGNISAISNLIWVVGENKRLSLQAQTDLF